MGDGGHETEIDYREGKMGGKWEREENGKRGKWAIYKGMCTKEGGGG